MISGTTIKVCEEGKIVPTICRAAVEVSGSIFRTSICLDLIPLVLT